MMSRIVFAAILLAGSQAALAEELDPVPHSVEPRPLKLRLDEMKLPAAKAPAAVIGDTEPMLAQTGDPQVITPIPMDPPPADAPAKKPYLSRITGWQWVGIGAAVIAAGVIVSESSGGGGGDGEPIDLTGGN